MSFSKDNPNHLKVQMKDGLPVETEAFKNLLRKHKELIVLRCEDGTWFAKPQWNLPVKAGQPLFKAGECSFMVEQPREPSPSIPEPTAKVEVPLPKPQPSAKEVILKGYKEITDFDKHLLTQTDAEQSKAILEAGVEEWDHDRPGTDLRSMIFAQSLDKKGRLEDQIRGAEEYLQMIVERGNYYNSVYGHMISKQSVLQKKGSYMQKVLLRSRDDNLKLANASRNLLKRLYKKREQAKNLEKAAKFLYQAMPTTPEEPLDEPMPEEQGVEQETMYEGDTEDE